MPIKSVLSQTQPKSTIRFPKLMQSTAGDVALFLSFQGKGVVLKTAKGDGPWVEGRLYSSDVFAIEMWSDFEGTLTLSNK